MVQGVVSRVVRPVAGSVIDTAASAVAQDFIAKYTMDDISGSTLVDETGNYNGTIVGATQVPGIIGNALSFDGVANRVTAPVVFDFVSGDFLVSLWINQTSQAATGQPVSWRGTAGDSSVMGLQITTSGKLRLFWFNQQSSGFYQFVESTATVNTVDDFHIMIQKSIGTYRVYLDNVEVINTIASPIHTFETTEIKLGGGYSTVTFADTEMYNGLIDQTYFYSRYLLPEERQALYDEGL